MTGEQCLSAKEGLAVMKICTSVLRYDVDIGEK